MVQYEYIRFLFYNKGCTKRNIAKQLGVHRNTVTKAIENDDHKYTLVAEKEKPINGEFIDRIKNMVQENSTKANKHKLTKKRMHEILIEEGYLGSYPAFTSIVRKIEEDENLSNQEAYLKLLPSKSTMQVDFGEMIVMHKGLPRKVCAFCAKLVFSKIEFIQIYPRQSTEFFFDGLNKAFMSLGGVPRKIVFDNLKQAVKKVEKEQSRVLQDEFIKFKAFYCFDAVFCGTAKGNEKGLIENLVKYTRNNYFLPYPQFIDFASTNKWLVEKCNERLSSQKVDGEHGHMMIQNLLTIGSCQKYITHIIDNFKHTESLKARERGSLLILGYV